MEQRSLEPIGSMLAGLSAETQSARRAGDRRSPTAELVGGNEVSRCGGEITYKFKRSSWPAQLQQDHGLLVRSGSSAGWHPVAGCEVVAEEVVLRCSAELGGQNIRASLRQDDARACMLLASALERLAEEGSQARIGRAGLILGGGRPKLGTEPFPERYVTGYGGLNPSQKTAVCRALASDVTFIWGPPGTGKTDVVARIVEGCARMGLTVLLAAPTNYAVDQALERVCNLLEALPEFRFGMVQRVGLIQLESLQNRYGSYIDPTQALARSLQELDGQVHQLREEQDRVREDGRARAEADTLAAQALESQGLRDQYVALLVKSRQELADVEAQVLDLLAKTQARQGRRILAGWAAKKVLELRARHDQLLAVAEQKRRALEGPEAAARHKSEEHLALCRRAEEADRRAACGSMQEIQHRAERIQQDLNNLDKERRAVEERVTKGPRVVAMTTHRSYQGRIPLSAIDVVVIDEAGMVDLPTSYHLASLATKTLVVAGDFRQLPAIVHGSDDDGASQEERGLVRQWVDRDAFHSSGVVTAGGIRRDDPRLSRLHIQYRMRPDICDLVNAVAYPDAPLVTGRDDVRGCPASELLARPLVLVDTSDHRQTGGSWMSNPVHAEVICEFLRRLSADVAPGGSWFSGEPARPLLGVLTPYVDQKRLLRRRLAERVVGAGDIVVDTVHRFQGSQCPIVLLDTVSGSSTRLSRFFESSGFDSETCRLVNVALSRAQDHLIVVANLQHLRSTLSPASEMRTMLDHLEAHAHRIDMHDLIPLRMASDLEAMPQEELDKPTCFGAGEAYSAIRWDLERAVDRVEVYCAFMARSRVQEWRPAFKSRIAHGVPVTVYTRDEPKNGPLIELLRSDGYAVVVRPKMHEKVVVVDDVLWMGSMNLLAQNESTELMTRIRSRGQCDEVQLTIQRARPGRVPRPSSGKPPGGMDRIYLVVPFADNDAVRVLGAKFDRAAKKWWIDGLSANRAAFAKWLPQLLERDLEDGPRRDS